MTLEKILHRASSLHQKGKLQEARALFEEALSLRAGWPPVLNALGTVLMDMGLYREAASHFQKASRQSPPYPPAMYNLARLCHATGDFKQAETFYRKTVEADPKFAAAWNNIGLILRDKGDIEQALECFRKVTSLMPEASQGWNHLALALEELELYPDAETAYQKAIRLDNRHVAALYNLAALKLRTGKKEEAGRLLEQVLDIDPDNESARFLLQGLGRLPAPEAAPISHVQKVFDECAGKFEKTLVDKLEYRTPEVLYQLVSPYLSRNMNILDLGCGTGLGAEFYRTHARFLAGMDASGKMLEIAREKKLYDRLICGDILSNWEMDGLLFDLIYSSDVFVYFGTLSGVLERIYSHLNNQGITAFSVEHLLSEHEDWRLRPNGRYAHSKKYIKNTLDKTGFRIEKMTDTVLRKEAGKDVHGLITVARKL